MSSGYQKATTVNPGDGRHGCTPWYPHTARKFHTNPAMPTDYFLRQQLRDGSLTINRNRSTASPLDWEQHLPPDVLDDDSDLEYPESDESSATGESFSPSPSPPPSIAHASLCHHPVTNALLPKTVWNTPYASQSRMFQFRRTETCIRWDILISGLLAGIIEEKGYQNNNYQLVGQGGSSSVWAAAFHADGQHSPDALAIKVFRADRKQGSIELPKEVRNLKDVKHNHIVAFVGHFERQDQFGVILYPLAICNLAQFLHNPPETRTRRMLLTATGCLSSAVKYLHTSMKIKHKDIKPENILVDKFGSVHLADFGISNRYKDVTVTIGQTPFTERYAPPEVVIQGERDLSSDIFSLGCVFFEMCTFILGEHIGAMNDAVFREEPKSYLQSLHTVASWMDRLKGLVGCESIPTLWVTSHDNCGITDGPDSGDQSLSTRHLDIIGLMMSRCPSDRPSISVVDDLFKCFTQDCLDCQHNLVTIPDVKDLDPEGHQQRMYIAHPTSLEDLISPVKHPLTGQELDILQPAFDRGINRVLYECFGQAFQGMWRSSSTKLIQDDTNNSSR